MSLSKSNLTSLKWVLAISVLFIVGCLLVFFNPFYAGNELLFQLSFYAFSLVIAFGYAFIRVRNAYRVSREGLLQQLETEKQKLKLSEQYLTQIEQGKLDVEISEVGASSIFGAIGKLQDKLLKNKADEQARIVEDEQRTWAIQGEALISDVLRQNNDNLEEYCYSIIRSIVKYLNVTQGCMYVANRSATADEVVLDLMACIAYDRQKWINRRLRVGEGLVGTCFYEKETILLTAIPNDYVSITSGLGGMNPSCIIIVPLMQDGEVLGVVELASMRNFGEHEVKLLEKMAMSVASTLATVRNNLQTAILLEESQQHSNEIIKREEELRQNNEELLATQEEMEQNNRKLLDYQNTLVEKEERLKGAAMELKLVEERLKANIHKYKQELVGSK